MSKPKKPKLTSHWANHEACCQAMAEKYGWTLVEARRRMKANDPLAVECLFLSPAEFPDYMED